MTLVGRVGLASSGRSAELVGTPDGLLLEASLRDAWSLRGARHALRRMLPLAARAGIPVRARIGALGTVRLAPRPGLLARMAGLRGMPEGATA